MTAQELGTANKFPSIQVFDWNGTPVKQLYLDCYISSFVVDETNQIIYGVLQRTTVISINFVCHEILFEDHTVMLPVYSSGRYFADQWLKGDTYTMKIFDGWVPSTTEKIEGKIGRRKIGRYNVTYTSRINIKESCSVEVLEYLNCKNGISVLQRDSLIYKESKKYRTIVWKKIISHCVM